MCKVHILLETLIFKYLQIKIFEIFCQIFDKKSSNFDIRHFVFGDDLLFVSILGENAYTRSP